MAAFSLAVTVLDQEQAGLPSALLSRKAAAASVKASQEKGYLDGRSLAEVFAWLRPNDLIWNYWVNNYLLGHAPKAFDILYWNADPVRMTAAMHRDFMELAISNGLTRPGGAKMLGSDVDLGKVDTDSYVVAGIADHLCKWESCYRTTQLLGGHSRFVLSTSGHIASMVNPPGNPKASFQTADREPRRHPGLAVGRLQGQGQLVGRLRRLARRAHGAGAQQAPSPGLRRLRAGLRRTGHLCPRPLSPGCAP